MTNANAAMAAAKEYHEGRKLRKELQGLNCASIADRHGLPEGRVRRIRRGWVDSSLVHDKYLQIKSEIDRAKRLAPIVERKSIKSLAERYHLSQLTIRRYAGLE